MKLPVYKRMMIFVAALVVISSVLYAVKNVYYQINQNACRQCGRCTLHCSTGAIQFNEQSGGLYINAELCNGCGNCVLHCPYGAIYSITANNDDTFPAPEIKLSCSPNPFSEYTDFKISIPVNRNQSVLKIHNSKGQLIDKYNLTNNSVTYRWIARDKQGKFLPAGVYFASICLGNTTITEKLTLRRK